MEIRRRKKNATVLGNKLQLLSFGCAKQSLEKIVYRLPAWRAFTNIYWGIILTLYNKSVWK